MDFQLFWSKYGNYIPFLVVSILIATGIKIKKDIIPIFLLGIFVIAEADIHKEIYEQCYKEIIALICLLILLCLVKHQKLSKWNAIGIVLVLFLFLVFIKRKYYN